MQTTVDPFWKWDNKTVPEEWAPDSGYEHDFDGFAAIQAFQKLNDYEQELIRLRTEGYTFSEIAKEINRSTKSRKSLNKIRSEILEIQDRLVAEE